jgi:hypothetical protein
MMRAAGGVAVGRRGLRWIAIGLLVCSAGSAAARANSASNACVLGYDEQRVAVVLDALKKAATSMTPDPLAPYIEYPFIARSPKGNIVIRSAGDLTRVFRRIFTEPVRSAILSQSLEDAFSNYQGVMIGNGQVWIGEVCRDRECQNTKYVIRAINF